MPSGFWPIERRLGAQARHATLAIRVHDGVQKMKKRATKGALFFW